MPRRAGTVMSNTLYRVVLTGELVSGFSREAVIASLARIFETSAANLMRVFEGGEHPIDDLLGAHEASVLQRRLERAGAGARVESIPLDTPEAELKKTGLHLPADDDPADAGLMHCPACGHAQLVAKSCDECGVVFAEFNRQRATRNISPGPVSAGAPSRPGPRPAPTRRATSNTTRDIHAAASEGWREDWLEEDEVPTEQYHLNLFMGRGSGNLTDACTGMILGRRTRFKLTWTGGAVISPFLWAMHRKMWALGMIIFVAEILIPVVLITLGTKDAVSDKVTLLGLGIMVANRLFWPAILKSLYCRHARLTIAQMHRMAPTFASDIDIATRGGTSKTAVFVGVVMAIVISLLAWSMVDTLYSEFAGSRFMFDTPVNLPSSERPQPGVADPVARVKDELLANENHWVSTRNRLRVLGQEINAWFADRGSTLDPKAVDIAQISSALSLDSEATIDGWGRTISFESDGKGYRLISAGPDGEFGNTDDVEYRRILER